MQITTRQPAHIPVDVGQAGFTQLSESFEAARRNARAEYVESFYRLAGKVVQVRVVGRALAAAYQRAYAPRAIQPPIPLPPTLTIDLWDEEVTALPYPLQPSANIDTLQILDLQHINVDPRANGDRQTQFGDESGRWIWEETEGSASWLDRKASRMIGWRAQGSQLPTHERSKPLSFFLPVCFYDQGIHILHAGVVARDGAGVLITGGSGIGKTTTTLCCLLAGLDYLSDDQVAVIAAEGSAEGFVAHSLYQSARLLPDHLQRFPTLQGHAILSHDPLDPKALLFLAELFPERVVAQAAIRAIALPRLSGQAQTGFQRATRAEALNYMARTSLMTALGVGRARFDHLTRLLGSAPCYWLDLGYDFAHIPVAIEELLQSTNA